MNKKPAFIAALLTTAIIAVAMLVIGISVYTDPNTVPVASSPAAAGVASASGVIDANVSLSTGSDQLSQLQSLVAQYQSREQQYQAQVQQLETQLSQANGQIQQYNQILAALQQRRVITIDSNGQISIPRRPGN